MGSSQHVAHPARWRTDRPDRSPDGCAGSRPSAGSAARARRVQERALAPVRRPPSSERAASTARKAGSKAMLRNTCTATKVGARSWAGESTASSPALEAQLDREADGVALEHLAGAPHRLDRVLARDARTPSPRSARAARWRRSRRTSRPARAGTRPRTRSGSGADRAREAPGDLVDRAEGVVVDHDVADVGAGARGVSGGSSVRSRVRVSATSACGKVQNSKWSWASARCLQRPAARPRAARAGRCGAGGTRERSAA